MAIEVRIKESDRIVGCLYDIDYQGRTDPRMIEQIKQYVRKQTDSNDAKVEIWVVPMRQIDTLENKVMVCWEVKR